MAHSKPKMDLRLEMRVKNNLLWSAIHDLHPTVAAFCREHSLRHGEVGGFISFRCSPFKKDGTYCLQAQRVSEALGIALIELFPPQLYDRILKVGSFKVVEVSSFAALPAAIKKEIRLLPAPVEHSPDVLCAESERREAIKAVLKTLTYREREIVKLRYGLGEDGRSYTLKEVASIFKLHRERIRQIEARAIRKLQQLKRSQTLVGFLD